MTSLFLHDHLDTLLMFLHQSAILWVISHFLLNTLSALVVVVDPNSGATSMRGDIGIERIFGLGYAYGSLYGFTDAGIVLEINASTGSVISSQNLPGTWWGATTNPVVW